MKKHHQQEVTIHSATSGEIYLQDINQIDKIATAVRQKKTDTPSYFAAVHRLTQQAAQAALSNNEKIQERLTLLEYISTLWMADKDISVTIMNNINDITVSNDISVMPPPLTTVQLSNIIVESATASSQPATSQPATSQPASKPLIKIGSLHNVNRRGAPSKRKATESSSQPSSSSQSKKPKNNNSNFSEARLFLIEQVTQPDKAAYCAQNQICIDETDLIVLHTWRPRLVYSYEFLITNNFNFADYFTDEAIASLITSYNNSKLDYVCCICHDKLENLNYKRCDKCYMPFHDKCFKKDNRFKLIVCSTCI